MKEIGLRWQSEKSFNLPHHCRQYTVASNTKEGVGTDFRCRLTEISGIDFCEIENSRTPTDYEGS